MLYLAKAVSARRNLLTVTDNRDAWTIFRFFEDEGNFADFVYDPDAEGFYAFLILDDIIPHNVGSVPMEDIIEFVSKRKEERGRLRKVIQSFCDKLQACSSAEHAKGLLNDYVAQLSESKADFRHSMPFFDQQQGHSLLTVGVSVGLAVFSTLGNDPYDPVRVGTSLLLGAVAAYADYQRQVKQHARSHVSYLVDMDERFVGGKALPAYHRSFEEFMND